jgi:peptide deformylase
MAILPLVVSPDPRLNVASALVAEVDDSVRRLMDDMLETMYHNDGIGLAAVQVGVHKRILVMDLRRSRVRYPDADGADAGEEEDGECGGGPYFMANPEIAFRSEEENVYPEGSNAAPCSPPASSTRSTI